MIGQAPSILGSLFWDISYEPSIFPSTFYHLSVSSLIITASYCWSALLFSTSCLSSHYVSGERTSVILTGQTGLYLFIEAQTNLQDLWRLTNIFILANDVTEFDIRINILMSVSPSGHIIRVKANWLWHWIKLLVLMWFMFAVFNTFVHSVYIDRQIEIVWKVES